MMTAEREGSGIPEHFDENAKILYGIPSLAYRPYIRMRDEWIASIKTPHHQEILDVGCSIGDALVAWTADNSLVGFDRDEKLLSEARRNGYRETICGDIYTHDFKGRQFDAVTAFGVVGAQPSLDKDFGIFRDVLKSGGDLYLILPLYGGIRRITRPFFRMIRSADSMGEIPTFQNLSMRLEENGFRIMTLHTSSMYLSGTVSSSTSLIQRSVAIYALVKAQKI